MLIIRTNDNSIIFHDAKGLSSSGCYGEHWKCQTVTDSDHYSVEHPVISGFKAGKYKWEGGVVADPSYTEPVIQVPVPQEITMRQARLALLDIGLLANVTVAINSLPEPDKTKAQIEWEYSNALQRDNPFVAVLGAALGLSSQDIDNLFTTAKGL